MSSFDDLNTNQAGLLTDAALEELGLSRQPFETRTSDGEWYADDTIDEQLADIKHALITGKAVLLILGPPGSGKSTLLEQLYADSERNIQCFPVSGTDRFKTYNLFAGMLEAFKLPAPNEPNQALSEKMLNDLIPCLQGMMDQNISGVVVLDDAAQIPVVEITTLLRAMQYINNSDETLLRVVLVGEESFEAEIPDLVVPSDMELPYNVLILEGLSNQRCKAYLNYCFSRAGYEGKLPLTNKDIAKINSEAAGLPDAVHAFAAQEINRRNANYIPDLPPEFTSTGQRTLQSFFSTKTLLGALALLLIVIGIMSSSPSKNDAQSNRYTKAETQKIEAEAETGLETSLDANSAAARLRLLAEERAAQAETANSLQTQTAQTSPTTNNTTVLNNQQSYTNRDEVEAAEAEAARIETARAEAEQQARAAAAKQAAIEQAAAEDAAAAKRRAAAEQQRKEQAEQEQAAQLAATKAANDKAAEAEQATVTSAALAALESPNWILVQDPKMFTVQMSAATDRNTVERFLAENELNGPNSIFTFKRKETTWYALLHGIYPSIEAARADIVKMPTGARSNQPWIRGVSRIQKSLKD